MRYIRPRIRNRHSTRTARRRRMIVGQGDYRYEVADHWEQLPEGWVHGDVAGVAVDSQDRVYVFNRGEHPLIIYDRDGRFVGHWGEGVFQRPHGITIQDDV